MCKNTADKLNYVISTDLKFYIISPVLNVVGIPSDKIITPRQYKLLIINLTVLLQISKSYRYSIGCYNTYSY